jgi:large subunit ribosomal protein L21
VYAVISTGGKQYRVQVGDLIDVEKLPGDEGAELSFEPLLVVDGDKVASSRGELDGARVTATVVEQFRGRKIRVFTYKNKSGQQRNMGHRQSLTRLLVGGIDLKKRGKATKATAKASTKASSKADKE